ncbi:MAG: hypothetical protein VYD26_03825 [Actinomycetota bacterium]|nr:hypothetical protein [Actinomycetota bacterium]
MEDFNSDPKPGRLVLPIVLIGMIATTYTFVRSIDEEPVVEEAVEEQVPEEEVEIKTEETTTTTTTTIPREVLDYIEELISEKSTADQLGQKVIEANEKWDNKDITYQEAQEEFKENISDAEQFSDTIAQPGPPDSNTTLVNAHEEIKTIAENIFQDTQEIFEGLMASDTGERRSAAIESFNTNIELLKQKIDLIVSSISNS